jgi:hypothetical protein
MNVTRIGKRKDPSEAAQWGEASTPPTVDSDAVEPEPSLPGATDTCLEQQEAVDCGAGETHAGSEQDDVPASDDSMQADGCNNKTETVISPLADPDLVLERVLTDSLEKTKHCHTAADRIRVINACIADLQSILRQYGVAERAA